MRQELSRASIVQCAATLARGGLVLYPTEGVWGLGCDPNNETAVRRLLALKQRDEAKGLILIAGTPSQLDAWVNWSLLDAEQHARAMRTWPGFHTWIVPCTKATPTWIRGEHDSVAVRVTAHPTVAALCAATGGAIVSTSANVAREPSPLQLCEVSAPILKGVDAVCEGETMGYTTASTIHDAVSGAILR